jgi:hypothetical protein
MKSGAQIACGLIALVAGQTTPRAGVVQPRARNHLELKATLDPSARRITGWVRWSIPNVSNHPLGEVRLWLYPNRLGDRPEALGDVNFHWLYPTGFSPSSLRIDAAAVGSAAASVTIEPSEAGRDTIARIALPAPIPPGEDVVVDVAFTTELPVRFGGFGCTGSACRLMGGYYPFPLHLSADGWQADAAPDRIDFTASVAVPAGTDILVGDLHAHATAAPVSARGANVPHVTLVTDRDLRAEEITGGGLRGYFFHHGARPPSSENEVMPYVREDRVGLILDAAHRALDFAAKQGLGAGDHDHQAPLMLIESPLRHEMVQTHANVILVSDRLFQVFPIERLRKFHRLEVIRAVIAAVAGGTLGRIEPDPDVDLSTEVIAAYLTDRFTMREFQRLEFARDLLRPISFIPAVDQLMYAPLVASSASYFGYVDDRDVVRDDVRRFSHRRPGGRLVYAKLVDLLGPAGMDRLGRIVIQERVPLRQAAARAFGADLDWFWRQWLAGPPPRVNYRLAGVHVASPRTPGPEASDGPAVHVTIDVERQGADLLEPVEVRVMDRADVPHDLVWTGRGIAHRFELDLPAGLASVEVDPRHRLVESAMGSLNVADDPLVDNRDPKRWRLIYSGFGALVDVTSFTASFAAAVRVKPRHDLRNSFLLLATHSPTTTIGIDTAYTRLFGRQADTNRLTSDVGIGLSALLLDPSFGVADTERLHSTWRLKASLFVEHDDRDFVIDPWRAVGAAADVHFSVTGLDTGERLSQVGADVELLRLFELLPGHVVALDVQGGATFGDIRVRSQLAQIGGALGLRGYAPGELFGRGRAVARLELRDRYVSDLNWNIAHFTAVRALGGNLFAEAGLITSCDDLGVDENDVFYDVGYSFRVLHDAFGVYQQMLSVDLAVPLNRHDRVCLGQHSLGPPNDPQMQIARPRFVVLISFLPTF